MRIVGYSTLNLVISASAGIFFGILGSLILKYCNFMRQNSMC